MTIPACSVFWGDKIIYAYNTYVTNPHRTIEDMQETSFGTHTIGDQSSFNASLEAE
jgi:hypothetical protein